MIKCNFGHSIDIELEPITDTNIPPVLYHGTARRNVDSIFKKGLVSKERNYVHLTSDQSVANQVGLRYGKNPEYVVILEIDAKQMLDDGLIIHATDTSTYLVTHVDAKYIENRKE